MIAAASKMLCWMLKLVCGTPLAAADASTASAAAADGRALQRELCSRAHHACGQESSCASVAQLSNACAATVTMSANDLQTLPSVQFCSRSGKTACPFRGKHPLGNSPICPATMGRTRSLQWPSGWVSVSAGHRACHSQTWVHNGGFTVYPQPKESSSLSPKPHMSSNAGQMSRYRLQAGSVVRARCWTA